MGLRWEIGGPTRFVCFVMVRMGIISGVFMVTSKLAHTVWFCQTITSRRIRMMETKFFTPVRTDNGSELFRHNQSYTANESSTQVGCNCQSSPRFSCCGLWELFSTRSCGGNKI